MLPASEDNTDFFGALRAGASGTCSRTWTAHGCPAPCSTSQGEAAIPRPARHPHAGRVPRPSSSGDVRPPRQRRLLTSRDGRCSTSCARGRPPPRWRVGSRSPRTPSRSRSGHPAQAPRVHARGGRRRLRAAAALSRLNVPLVCQPRRSATIPPWRRASRPSSSRTTTCPLREEIVADLEDQAWSGRRRTRWARSARARSQAGPLPPGRAEHAGRRGARGGAHGAAAACDSRGDVPPSTRAIAIAHAGRARGYLLTDIRAPSGLPKRSTVFSPARVPQRPPRQRRLCRA